MKHEKITFNLKKTLKEDFIKKVESDNNFSGINEALNDLILEHIYNSKQEYSIHNKVKKTNGFYLDKDTKEAVELYVNYTKEFINNTDFFTKIIFNYVNNKGEKHD